MPSIDYRRGTRPRRRFAPTRHRCGQGNCRDPFAGAITRRKAVSRRARVMRPVAPAGRSPPTIGVRQDRRRGRSMGGARYQNRFAVRSGTHARRPCAGVLERPCRPPDRSLKKFIDHTRALLRFLRVHKCARATRRRFCECKDSGNWEEPISSMRRLTPSLVLS